MYNTLPCFAVSYPPSRKEGNANIKERLFGSKCNKNK
jgi:hypothetical protein